MEEINWIEMMEKMQDIRHFCSLYVRRRCLKGSISSAQELDVLSRLELSEESLTPQMLVSAMGITKPAVSRLVDGLEKKGLVRKEPSSTDRRSHHLVITEEGSAQVQATYTYYLSPIYELRRRMGGADFDRLADLIHQANDCMKDDVLRSDLFDSLSGASVESAGVEGSAEKK